MDITKFANDPERRKRLIEELKKQEADRLAAMSPDERADYEKEQKILGEYQEWLDEPAPITRGDLASQEEYYGHLIDQAESDRDEALADAEKMHRSLSYALTGLGQASANTENARTHQSAQDKLITNLHKRIKELESERDAARLAYLELLEKTEAAKGHATK